MESVSGRADENYTQYAVSGAMPGLLLSDLMQPTETPVCFIRSRFCYHLPNRRGCRYSDRSKVIVTNKIKSGILLIGFVESS